MFVVKVNGNGDHRISPSLPGFGHIFCFRVPAKLSTEGGTRRFRQPGHCQVIRQVMSCKGPKNPIVMPELLYIGCKYRSCLLCQNTNHHFHFVVHKLIICLCAMLVTFIEILVSRSVRLATSGAIKLYWRLHSSWGRDSWPLNGHCKPSKQGSVQKNKEIWHTFLLKMYFWASWGEYCPPLPLPGYAYVFSDVI